MKNFKEHLEIEVLKALSYEQINKLLNDLAKENRELKKQCAINGVSQQRELLAISCLKNITDPIKYLKELAESDGCKLDGAMAIQMTRNGMFYQELANKVLKEIDNCG